MFTLTFKVGVYLRLTQNPKELGQVIEVLLCLLQRGNKARKNI